MAQNITIQGASYSDVPSVTLPKTGGGTAYFTDVTATTATESDVASGKIFYKSDGSQAVGSHVDSGGTIAEDGNGDIELGKTGNVALITPLSVTENGTYTAPSNTGYSPVDVNVSGGGGEQIYELIGEGEYPVSTTSTSETVVGDLNLTKNVDDVTGYLYIRIRDKAGKRAGYFYGMDAWVYNMIGESGLTGAISFIPKCLYAYDANMRLRGYNTSSAYTVNGGQGVYVKSIVRSTNYIRIAAKYSSTTSGTGTIDGTFLVQVYAVKYPNGTF
jgi:hypothetical protein